MKSFSSRGVVAATCLFMLTCLTKHTILGFPSQLSDKVVYNNDDRKDVCQHPSELFRNISTNAIAAIVDVGVLGTAVNGEYAHLQSFRPLGARRALCSGQKFADNPTAALCSATLIAPDRVLTAGHCISDTNCGRRKFVFDYMYTSEGCTMPQITEEDVFSCVRVKRIETDQIDFAVVWLDRSVTGRVPVQVMSTPTAMSIGQSVTVIGFGSGIPAKIDQGGYVIDPRPTILDYFVASTDTFAGNSGSGVFNDAGVLIGILVRGQVDYIRVGNCYQVNVVGCSDENCSKLQDAEEITYAYRAIQAAPNCNANTDCVVANAGSTCSRKCAADSDECTGWCL